MFHMVSQIISGLRAPSRKGKSSQNWHALTVTRFRRPFDFRHGVLVLRARPPRPPRSPRPSRPWAPAGPHPAPHPSAALAEHRPSPAAADGTDGAESGASFDRCSTGGPGTPWPPLDFERLETRETSCSSSSCPGLDQERSVVRHRKGDANTLGRGEGIWNGCSWGFSWEIFRDLPFPLHEWQVAFGPCLFHHQSRVRRPLRTSQWQTCAFSLRLSLHRDAHCCSCSETQGMHRQTRRSHRSRSRSRLGRGWPGWPGSWSCWSCPWGVQRKEVQGRGKDGRLGSVRHHVGPGNSRGGDSQIYGSHLLVGIFPTFGHPRHETLWYRSGLAKDLHHHRFESILRFLCSMAFPKIESQIFGQRQEADHFLYDHSTTLRGSWPSRGWRCESTGVHLDQVEGQGDPSWMEGPRKKPHQVHQILGILQSIHAITGRY